jgi:hypothetical protein
LIGSYSPSLNDFSAISLAQAGFIPL